MSKTILMIGAFDSKGQEFAFLREQILARGHSVITVNTAILDTWRFAGEIIPVPDRFPVDIGPEEIAKAGGGDLNAMREKRDRLAATKIMAKGLPAVIRSLYEEGRFDGIVGGGGSQGTFMATTAMRALPFGVPKVCVSIYLSKYLSKGKLPDLGPFLESKDITMIPSIVDVKGMNRVTRTVLSRAAGAICGMVETPPLAAYEDKTSIHITGRRANNSTFTCTCACEKSLYDKGYDVHVHHADGIGGKLMEILVSEGVVDAVLDIATTELANNICGGDYDAGPGRLSAPGKMGIPHLIVPGCVDMVSFEVPETIPQKYKDVGRKFYKPSFKPGDWYAQMKEPIKVVDSGVPGETLMRTNAEENKKLGELFAERANAAKGPVAFLLPLKGLSVFGGDGGPLCDREADGALFDAIKANVREDIPVVELENNINDPEFSAKAVEMMLELISKKK